MTDSILTSVKAALGMTEDYRPFDSQIIMHINSVFSILQQLGVGPDEGFSIEDESTEWCEYTSELEKLNLVRSYMYLKVRLLFDPPTNSFLVSSFEKQISEYEWRLNVAVDPKK